ncbi:hypothetical protein BGX38DRAFT_1279541 [Terfezia claveryi]|nr:hypothetical protein BGX38DRAFT_1279541 [Terfezia claveryi]
MGAPEMGGPGMGSPGMGGPGMGGPEIGGMGMGGMGMGGMGMGRIGMGGPEMGGPGMGGPGMGGPGMGGPGMGDPGIGGMGMGEMGMGGIGMGGIGIGGPEMGGPGMGGSRIGGSGMGGLGMGGPGMGGPGMGGPGAGWSGDGSLRGQSPMYKIPVGGFQNPAGFRAWGGSDSPSLLTMGNVKHVNMAKEQVVRAEVGAMSRAESVESGTMRSEPVGVSLLLEGADTKSVMKVAGVKDVDIGNVEPVKERGSKRVRESSASVGVNMADKVENDPNVENNSKGKGEGNGKPEPKADSKKKSLGHAKRPAPNWYDDTIEDNDLILAQ